MIRAAEYFRETMYVDRFPHILECNKHHRTIEITKITTIKITKITKKIKVKKKTFVWFKNMARFPRTRSFPQS